MNPLICKKCKQSFIFVDVCPTCNIELKNDNERSKLYDDIMNIITDFDSYKLYKLDIKELKTINKLLKPLKME